MGRNVYCSDNVAYRQFVYNTLKAILQEVGDVDIGEHIAFVQNTLNEILSGVTLEAGDIRYGASAFGVVGTFTEAEEDDDPATAGDIVVGKVAYVNGEKIVGTLEIEEDEEVE